MVIEIMVCKTETVMVCHDEHTEFLHLTELEALCLNEFLIGHSRQPYPLQPEWGVRPLYSQACGYYARLRGLPPKILGNYKDPGHLELTD